MIVRANSLHIPLADESVHCCITSPPYWSLRDYNTPGQLGLERTPEEYVENTILWAREVWRVLRNDGTFWLNLGSSYASDDICPSQSPLLRRVPACDTCGIEFQDFQNGGHACSDSCDEHQDESQNRRDCNAHNDQSVERDERQILQTGHDTENLDCGEASPDAFVHGVHRSTIRASFRRDRAACVPSTTASVFQQERKTFSGDARPSDGKTVYNSDISQKSQPLVVRTQGKESFFSACQSPNCKGIGNCGLCWCNLAIPSLNIKRKDLINIPTLVSLALQADGWIVRSDIIWAKLNPMPESVTDRPTKAHEYIFLLTKSQRYFYDADAIREAHNDINRPNGFKGKDGIGPRYDNQAWAGGTVHLDKHREYNPAGRNKRTVWTIATQAYPDAHFATFPEKLVVDPIKAGTSEKGCCAECGAPWERVVEDMGYTKHRPSGGNDPRSRKEDKQAQGYLDGTHGWKGNNLLKNPPKTLGWRPTCACEAGVVPCIVLDPFGGSGTVKNVAERLGRRAVCLELSAEYIRMAKKRCVSPQGSLF